METIKAYSDIVIKYIMGREETKDILLAFINAVLLDAEFDEITEIEIIRSILKNLKMIKIPYSI